MIESKPNINVLLYHQIGRKPTNQTNLDCFCLESEFHNQMNYLKENNYEVISLNRAIELITFKTTIKKNYIILTFDDGCNSFYNTTYPILDYFNFKASVYPITGFLNNYLEINSKKYEHIKILSESMIKELSLLDVHFGAHTVNHLKLTQLEDIYINKEIKNSKSYLEQLLGYQIDSFSFPHGKYNKKIIEIVKNNGFTNSLTCNNGFFQTTNSLFEIPRKYITYFDTIETFKQKLNLYE